MSLLADLGWLRRPPGDLRDRCRVLGHSVNEPDLAFDTALVDIGSYGLDINQLNWVSRLVGLRLDSHIDTVLARFRLGLLGSGTLSLVSRAIPGSGVRHLTLIDVVEGEYGRSLEDALNPCSRIRAAQPDGVLLAFDYRDLHLDRAIADPTAAAKQVDAAFSHLRTIAENLRPSLKGPLLLQTLVPPTESLYGSLDSAEVGSPYAMVTALNERIARWTAQTDDVLVDAARLATAIGLQNWHDPAQWHAAKLPFAPELVPLYADLIARTVAAIRGKARKCLVLDLDNTLWGGVIGDDGLEGIKLGQGSAEGEAYLAIQRAALEYRARGIVLAVSSKNDETVARQVFRTHPEMLLRDDHIAVFQVNWQDKASNLRAIAERLNIGIDTLVFLDDNPFEREQVRRELPLVAVPELPAEPALYPTALAWAGYFEAVSISTEDRKRADFYEANATRNAVLAESSDIESYLRSLNMSCTITSFDHIGRARIAQLINKSNQFNLTTRRYSENEVAAMESAPHKFTMQVRLTDKFGDNGMISVIVFDRCGNYWMNDIWLMSCRVLGRRVEEAALAYVCAAAKAEGAEQLIGRYIPSAKNQMVANHYGKLGFQQIETREDGETVWTLDLHSYCPPKLPMLINTHVTVAAVEEMCNA
jgi:FkbH-like protein